MLKLAQLLGLFVVFSMWRIDESQMARPANSELEDKIREELKEIAPAGLTVALPARRKRDNNSQPQMQMKQKYKQKKKF